MFDLQMKITRLKENKNALLYAHNYQISGYRRSLIYRR
jgi:quinolinate synthase